MEGECQSSILGQLHHSVQQQILSHLRTARDIHHASLTCKEVRELCLSLVGEIRIPKGATPQRLQHQADKVIRTFTSANSVVLKGEHTRLSPHSIDDFIVQLAASRMTSLRLQELLLSSNLAIATLCKLPQTWNSLEHIELLDTPLSCPLECTEPVALDQLVRKLYAFQGHALPHITVLRAQVEEHEKRVDANLLVTHKVMEGFSRLPHLRSLTVISRYLHLHDLAVASLARSTSLSSLTLQLPVDFPQVTAHGLKALPMSLSELRLLTRTPVATWQALAALSQGRPHSFRCHLEVDAEGGTQAVGSVRGPRGVAADPIAAMARALNVPTGLPRIRNQAAGGRAGRGQAAGGAVFGGAGGRGRGRAGAGLHDNEAGAGLLAGVLQMGADEQVPAEGLLPLPALRSLRFRSGAAEAPEPEDDEEEAPPNPVELREVELLGAMLNQAPALDVLELTNAGPLLTALAARHAPTGPKTALHVSCHSRVDGSQLLIASPLAHLHLMLKGVGAAGLQSLVECAAASVQPFTPAQARAPTTAAHSSQALQVEAAPQERMSHSQVSVGRGSSTGLGAKLPWLLAPSEAASSQLPMQGNSQQEAAVAAQPEGLSPGQGLLVSLHLQRSHEVTDAACAAVLEALPCLRLLTLTTCRIITSELVVLAARLRRPVRLRVVSCRLVSAAGWEKAIQDARSIPGTCLVDVKYPDDDDLGFEVEFA